MDEVVSTASKEDKTEQQTKSHTTVESGSANGPKKIRRKNWQILVLLSLRRGPSGGHGPAC